MEIHFPLFRELSTHLIWADGVLCKARKLLHTKWLHLEQLLNRVLNTSLERCNEYVYYFYGFFQFPKLNNLCFPGKKTFNNLDSHFLEKRTKALNIYMMVCSYIKIQMRNFVIFDHLNSSLSYAFSLIYSGTTFANFVSWNRWAAGTVMVDYCC